MTIRPGSAICRSTALMCLLLWPLIALAGPPEDADAVLTSWSAAYTSNDPEAIASHYWSDGILLGTVSPVISTGTDAIRSYFGVVKGTGNKNEIRERRAIVVDDNAVVITGFYTFVRMKDGISNPTPARYTMLITRRNGVWRIAHHHSSPQVLPR